jgi:hypothetical protein
MSTIPVYLHCDVFICYSLGLISNSSPLLASVHKCNLLPLMIRNCNSPTGPLALNEGHGKIIEML